MGFHTNHTHHVMIMNKTQHAVLQNRGLNVKTDERKILYSSFRPLYLCTFASDKSCLTEIHRKLQNLRLLPSHYLSLWEKLISRLFLIYSYSNIVFFYKKDTTGKASKVQIRDETAYSQIAVCNATLALEQTEQMPSFQSGDMKAFHNWVNSQIRYPAEAFKNNLGGKVVAQFTVDQAGSVGDIKILQSPDKCFSDEVTRILESSPKWTPGRDEKGDAVKVSLVIPVDFRMTAEKPSEN